MRCPTIHSLALGLIFSLGCQTPSLAVTFNPPGDAAPRQTAGGASRGGLTFNPPGDAAPRQTAGGSSRAGVTFDPPGDPAPARTAGSSTRGAVTFDPPGDPAPQQTVGSSSRGEEYWVTALVPETNHGRTVAERPTFFIYLPEMDVREGFFSIQDEHRNGVYQTYIEIPEHGGIISFTLPEDAPPLEVDRDYEWHFVPINGETLRPDSPEIVGWIKRVAPSSNLEKIARAGASLDLANAYGQQGIWYDTLSTLVTLKQLQPDNTDLNGEWSDLLEQVGLGAIAPNSVVPIEPKAE
ncbi:MAG TPA: DUF928 domain-containing protein [Oscillatoriales cyanobacterium M4454_W2019_049]|nr:DUF928 domain-containing protein [Oscillatoriales cyanobacterium M4454_W2019_049]